MNQSPRRTYLFHITHLWNYSVVEPKSIVRASNNFPTTSLKLKMTFLASWILLFLQRPILLSNLKVLDDIQGWM
jgi:hypothetical protein